MTETWLGQLPFLGLVLARCAGVCALAPPTGWAHFPPLLRLGVATALAVPLAALLAPHAPARSLAPAAYLGLLAGNALVGLLIGGGLWLLVEAFRVAGRLTELWLDGAGASEQGPLSGFLHMVAVLFFVQLGGLRWLVVFLRQGCEVLPVTGGVSWHAVAGPWLQWPALMLATGLRVAAPMLLAVVLASAMAATLARAMGEVQISQVAPALRFTVLVVVLGAIAPLLAGLAMGEMDRWANELATALNRLSA